MYCVQLGLLVRTECSFIHQHKRIFSSRCFWLSFFVANTIKTEASLYCRGQGHPVPLKLWALSMQDCVRSRVWKLCTTSGEAALSTRDGHQGCAEYSTSVAPGKCPGANPAPGTGENLQGSVAMWNSWNAVEECAKCGQCHGTE